MRRRSGWHVALLGAALALPVAPPALAWTGTIVCESHGYRRNFCRVDTEGRVRLVREISHGNLCRQGRGWGFDNRGIWVDRGCRGVFEFGRGRASPPRRGNDAAIAAGVIGAMLGASATASRSAPPPPPPPAAQVPVPAWAIGSFRAFDPDAGQIVQLIVQSNGATTLRDERGTAIASGLLRDGMVFWNNGSRSWLAREEAGLLLGDVETGRHFNFLRS